MSRRIDEAALAALRGLSKAASFIFVKKNLPYKVTNYDPKTKQHTVITSRWTFPEAYSHPEGTHVVQTHAPEGEFQRIVQGGSGGSENRMAQRGAAGYLLGGMTGAAIGVATSGGSKYGKWYELPQPIITPKASGRSRPSGPDNWLEPPDDFEPPKRGSGDSDTMAITNQGRDRPAWRFPLAAPASQPGSKG